MAEPTAVTGPLPSLAQNHRKTHLGTMKRGKYIYIYICIILTSAKGATQKSTGRGLPTQFVIKLCNWDKITDKMNGCGHTETQSTALTAGS